MGYLSPVRHALLRYHHKVVIRGGINHCGSDTSAGSNSGYNKRIDLMIYESAQKICGKEGTGFGLPDNNISWLGCNLLYYLVTFATFEVLIYGSLSAYTSISRVVSFGYAFDINNGHFFPPCLIKEALYFFHGLRCHGPTGKGKGGINKGIGQINRHKARSFAKAHELAMLFFPVGLQILFRNNIVKFHLSPLSWIPD